MTTETEKPSGFSKFNLSHNLNRALDEASFFTPTPIQDATIPLGLQGKDVLACAQTGTGKTAAFLLPTITHLEKNTNEMALILGPTREIVQQIADAARLLTLHVQNVDVCAIIGGGRIDRQQKALQKKPRLIIGTPGRMNDFIARRKINLSECRTLVFDEADRMLDMGFAPQIDQIVKFIPKERQTMMFSATIAPAVEKISKTYLRDAKFISVGQKETAPELLRQKAIVTTLDQKEIVLHSELTSRKGSVLIFAQTQRKVEKLGYKLREAGFNAETIHGGRTQGQRFRALKCFRDGDVNILVATDVASRGLDIGIIAHVINFDLPSNPEDFLHRVGRTARNGKDGDALTLMVQADFSEFRGIKKYMPDCEMVGQFTQAAMQSTGGGQRFGGNSGGRNKRYGGNKSNSSGGGGGFRRDRPASGSSSSSGGSRFGRNESRGNGESRSSSFGGGFRSEGRSSAPRFGNSESRGNSSKPSGIFGRKEGASAFGGSARRNESAGSSSRPSRGNSAGASRSPGGSQGASSFGGSRGPSSGPKREFSRGPRNPRS